VVGQGPPVIVVHGGPDFDHRYLLPDMERLATDFTLVFYDQRGRGESLTGVRSEEVSLTSEIADLEWLRLHLDLGGVTLLGHSFGTLLAVEYAIRHPENVSHLILMNTAPASPDDRALMIQTRRRATPDDIDEMGRRAATPRFRAGDPEAVTAYYRVHFRSAVARPGDLDRVMEGLRSSLTRERILLGRAIEDRLVAETWGTPTWSLLPRLEQLAVPTLVIHGERDFVPIECAANLAAAIPGARLLVLEDCGHFAYLEAPGQIVPAIKAFMEDSMA
jgi:proline iminopeptidase